MKKLFLILVIGVCSLSANAQHWDMLGRCNNLVIRETGVSSLATSGRYISATTFVATSQNKIVVPDFIMREYAQGAKLYSSGAITISIGCCIAAVGAAVYYGGIVKNNRAMDISGAVLTALGTTTIGVSVPLLCWGDHIKRSANNNLRLYSALK